MCLPMKHWEQDRTGLFDLWSSNLGSELAVEIEIHKFRESHSTIVYKVCSKSMMGL